MCFSIEWEPCQVGTHEKDVDSHQVNEIFILIEKNLFFILIDIKDKYI